VIRGVLDMFLLREIRGRNENALAQVIDKYTAYICTVIRNAVGDALAHEDIEELCSDVFATLWVSASKVEKLKPYIAAVARNKAKNKMREVIESLPLDESIAVGNGITLEDVLISEDERRVVQNAVLSMGNTDRDIFLRHYYGSQSIAYISRETGISEAAIKKRLARGRKKLKAKLDREVFSQ
jgi:RNA polymerase sigma-70 factor (ECF subfamily)